MQIDVANLKSGAPYDPLRLLSGGISCVIVSNRSIFSFGEPIGVPLLYKANG
jgi:hypothetical protein